MLRPLRTALVRSALAVGATFALAAPPTHAADELSTDVTVELDGTLANDEDVVEDVPGSVAKIDVGTLPANADVIGYSVGVDQQVLFSLDTAVALPGGVTTTPRDVVRWNGSLYSVVFDGADRGVPDGAQIDAIGVLPDGDLLLSFDVTVTLGGVTADDEDLLRFDSPSTWTLHFDGSAEGVPAAADLDGADRIDASGDLALSFDISGTAGGVAFDDEDILAFHPATHLWSMRADGSSRHPELAAADVDAVFVPEPFALGAGLVALAVIGARRRRRAAGALLVLGVAGFGAPAWSSDGVYEINQACALAGCFPGDTAGFPVTGGARKSYRLTSDLTVPDAATSAVRIGDYATLDLGGFVIRGPIVCTGLLVAVCPDSAGPADGVASGIGATIRNGTIRGMGGSGIAGDDATLVENMMIEENAARGISASQGARGWIVRDSRIVRNGSFGIDLAVQNGYALITGNVIAGNEREGIYGVNLLILDNSITSNGDYGISLNFASQTSAFGGNVLHFNNGGDTENQTVGGIQIRPNICATDAICP